MRLSKEPVSTCAGSLVLCGAWGVGGFCTRQAGLGSEAEGNHWAGRSGKHSELWGHLGGRQ